MRRRFRAMAADFRFHGSGKYSIHTNGAAVAPHQGADECNA
jgi:hypothetical protein